MNSKKILVLGASSDIGIKLIKEILKKTDMEIYAHYSSSSSELKKIKHENLKIFKADFCPRKLWRTYFSRAGCKQQH